MKALGVGWTVQDAMYFGGEGFVRQAGPDAARRVPPVVTADRLGVSASAAAPTRTGWRRTNPFTALQWFLDGKTVSGLAMRGPEEIPTRQQALRFYTKGSAWFSHDDGNRGSLEVGKLADLAVLSKDYLTVPVAEVGDIESVLTLLGGRVHVRRRNIYFARRTRGDKGQSRQSGFTYSAYSCPLAHSGFLPTTSINAGPISSDAGSFAAALHSRGQLPCVGRGEAAEPRKAIDHTAQKVGRQPVPHRRPRVPAAHRWRDVHQLEPRLGEEHRQPRADARVAALGFEERAIGRQEALPRGGRWDHAQRLALVVLDGEDAAGPERADELPHVRRRIRKRTGAPSARR